MRSLAAKNVFMAELSTTPSSAISTELNRLRAAYVTVAKHSIRLLRTGGLTSASFQEADRELRAIARRINEISGTRTGPRPLPQDGAHAVKAAIVERP